jgi:hypothetical protein
LHRPKGGTCGDLIDVRSPKLSSTGTSTFLTIRYSYRPIAQRRLFMMYVRESPEIAQAPHHPKEACVLVFPFQVKGICREKRKGLSKASSFLPLHFLLFVSFSRCRPAIVINSGRVVHLLAGGVDQWLVFSLIGPHGRGPDVATSERPGENPHI